MNAAIAAAGALALYFLGYRFYSKFLAEKVFGLRENVVTPAHRFRDGVDYVPTNPWILFGHHFASIAGLAPMLGPAVAVIWGWFPAMVWVLFGAIFVGCVHDFSAMVVSLRARGLSIGKVAEGIIGKRAKSLFHVIIFFLVALAMGVFTFVIAFLFTPAPAEASAAARAVRFPQAVVPSFGMMIIASVMGFLAYRHEVSWKILAPLGFLGTLLLTYVSQNESLLAALTFSNPAIWNIDLWMYILLGYAFLAAVLPVWTLLQPRDFLNSFLLYLGLGGMYLGFFILSPKFVNDAIIPNPPNAPGIFPFVFIVIACGAASGFHSLVSSGTTAKQLHKETHARPIGYGGMIGESLLGLMAVLATTSGINSAAWSKYYGDWKSVQGLGAKVGLFIQGSATFLESLGLSRSLAETFISLIVVSFALTSLDSATRLLRYNLEEISESIRFKPLANRYVASIAAVLAIAFFAFYKVEVKVPIEKTVVVSPAEYGTMFKPDGTSERVLLKEAKTKKVQSFVKKKKAAGLALWRLFGTTNQLLAGLALLAVTLYLLKRGKPWYYTGVPMVFLLGTTLFAAVQNSISFYNEGAWPLFAVGILLIVLAVWLVIEGGLAVVRFRKEGRIIESLEVFAEDQVSEKSA